MYDQKKKLLFTICTIVCAGWANNQEYEVFSPPEILIFNYLNAGYVKFGWIPGISISLSLTQCNMVLASAYQTSWFQELH